MVGVTFYLYPLCVLLLTPGIKSEHNSNLTFSCPGNETSIGNLANGVQIGDICGEDFLLEFDGSASPLVNGQVKLIFSSDDEFDPISPDIDDQEIASFSWGGSYSKMNIPKSTTISVNTFEIKCGSGYLIAIVSDGNKVVEQAAERIIKTCDSTGLDVEIEVSDVGNDSLIIEPGISLQSQLSMVGKSLWITLKNRGYLALPNTTIEGSHILAVYVQKQDAMYSTYMSSSGCTVPNLTVFDAVLNVTTFTRGMMVGEEMYVDQNWVNTIAVSYDDDQHTICGDANLVFMFDPFYQYDNNPCNNFKMFRVNINCNNIPYKQKCFTYTNAMVRGHTAHVVYADNYHSQIYEYFSGAEDSWRQVSNYDYDRKGIMGYARLRILYKLLGSLNNDPYRGLCKMADRLDQEYEIKMMNDSMNDTIYMSTTEMPTTETTDDPQLMSARSTIDQLNYQLSSNSLPDWTSFQNSLNAINGMASTAQVDKLQKYKFYGIALGLNLSYHYAYYKTMYPHLPANASRLTLGHALRGLAHTFVHAYKAGFSAMEKEMYLGPLVMYFAALQTAANHIPVPEPLNSMMPRIKRAIMSFVRQYQDVNYKPESTCPFKFHDLESVPFIARFLVYLADSAREDVEETPDTGDLLERCHRRLVATYFRYGGKSIIARDIHRQLVSEAKAMGNDLHNVPDGCRKNPFQTLDVHPLYWKNDDGRIKIGFKSPWNAGFMIWRVIGVCKCDQCNGGYGAYQYSTSTPSYSYYGSTTYGYGYPSSSSVYNG